MWDVIRKCTNAENQTWEKSNYHIIYHLSVSPALFVNNFLNNERQLKYLFSGSWSCQYNQVGFFKLETLKKFYQKGQTRSSIVITAVIEWQFICIFIVLLKKGGRALVIEPCISYIHSCAQTQRHACIHTSSRTGKTTTKFTR